MTLKKREGFIVAMIIIGVNCLVYVPFMIYCYVIYYAKRDHSYIRNRRYNNVLFIVAVAMVYLVSLVHYIIMSP